MDAREFYRLADQLCGDNKCEATYREVISLSYYACYHLVTPITESRVPKPSKTGIHKQLCQGLVDYGQYNHDGLPKSLATKFKRLGLMLDTARKNRTNASYYLNNLTITQKDADAQMRGAQSIMQLVDEIARDLT